jgi:hypothetical protein
MALLRNRGNTDCYIRKITSGTHDDTTTRSTVDAWRQAYANGLWSTRTEPPNKSNFSTPPHGLNDPDVPHELLLQATSEILVFARRRPLATTHS